MNWTVEKIRELLKTDDRAVVRALLKLYSLQTEEEKRGKHTDEHNRVGFSQVDSEFLTNLVESYLKYHRLTDRQIAAARRRVLKYAGQLLRTMNQPKVAASAIQAEVQERKIEIQHEAERQKVRAKSWETIQAPDAWI